jgi:hypothetical protein
MSEGQDFEPFGGRGEPEAPAAVLRKDFGVIHFNRAELDAILRVYGRRVADGEWRDYAIDHFRDQAVFSVFRRAREYPLYRIIKEPKLGKRQGAYRVVAAGGLILKRGHDLGQVLRVLEPSLRAVSA